MLATLAALCANFTCTCRGFEILLIVGGVSTASSVAVSSEKPDPSLYADTQLSVLHPPSVPSRQTGTASQHQPQGRDEVQGAGLCASLPAC